MTVLRAIDARVIVSLVVVLAASGARAQSVAFKHQATVYRDAKDGKLSAPEGVACNDAGLLVIADTGNARLLTYFVKEGTVTPAAEVKVPQLKHPVRLQLDSKGNMLVLDRKLRKIARLDAKGAFQGYVDLKPAGVTEVVPTSFKVDRADNLYVLDTAAAKVFVADPSGAVTATLPLPADAGAFMDVAVDAGGIVYVLDAVRATVWSAAKGATAFSPLGKSFKDYASFPTYLTANNRGVLLAVDQNGAGLVLLGQDGSYLGRQLSLGWTDGLLYYPSQICLDAQGDAFVADRSNNRVQMFTSIAQ
ncbi:NHL repeat-containing protein [Anaeromyxobacter sp. SG66]|uniref:NHL repeat-containing protein n=1 Tax=Anaeromyxobacter sp. SG66 TaxID=2925410 RepID=UPI001F58A90A|nr:NHL repeat-containing protein [Anaeromyxobacter sp. SG66]